MRNNLKFPISNSRGGFTIVELTVSLALFVIVSLFFAYLATYQLLIYNTETAELNVTSDARTALDDIDNYVRQSNRVVTNYTTYTTGSQTLVLQIASIDASNNIINATYDNVVFYLSGTDLFRKVFPNVNSSRPTTTKKLATGVDTSNFSFSYDNADYSLVKQVTTNITVNQNLGGQNRSITVNSQSKLRSY